MTYAKAMRMDGLRIQRLCPLDAAQMQPRAGGQPTSQSRKDSQQALLRVM